VVFVIRLFVQPLIKIHLIRLLLYNN